MGLADVARFSVLGEAQVARTVLQSAGFAAFLADEGYGTVDWQLAVALQGYRVTVPASDLDDARAVLTAAHEAGAAAQQDSPLDLRRPKRTAAWIAAALVVGPTTSGSFLAEETRVRPTLARWITISIFGLMTAYLWLGVFAIGLQGGRGAGRVLGALAMLVLLAIWMVNHALADEQRAARSAQP